MKLTLQEVETIMRGLRNMDNPGEELLAKLSRERDKLMREYKGGNGGSV